MNENFNFETTKFVMGSVAGVTDGTTAENVINATFQPMTIINGAQSVAFVEPERLATADDKEANLNGLTRLLIFATRAAATGTWDGELRFRRDADATSELIVAVEFLDGPVAVPVIIDGPFPFDFMTAHAAPDIDDSIGMQLRVTPGQAVARAVNLIALIVPGFRAGDSNKGANLSGLEFLANA